MTFSVDECYILALPIMGIGVIAVITISLTSMIKLYVFDSSWIDKTYCNLKHPHIEIRCI